MNVEYLIIVDAGAVVSFIQAGYQAGKSKAEITADLIKGGWQKGDIDAAFASIPPPVNTPVPPQANEFAGRFFGPIELLKKAWKVYKNRFWTLVSIYLFPLLSLVLFWNLFSFISAFGQAVVHILLGIILFLFVLIWSFVLAPWLQLALIYAISQADNQVGFKESFQKTRSKIISYWWMAILQGAISWGMFMLLFIPGLIFGIWASFSSYILVEEDLRGLNILLKSREYVRGHWWGVFGRMLVFFILMIVLFILFGIIGGLATLTRIPFASSIISNLATIIIVPFSLVLVYQLYRNLRELKGEFVFEPNKNTRTWWIVIGVLGALMVPIATIILIAINPAKQISLSNDVKRKMDLSAVKNALQMYAIAKHQYPGSLNELSPDYLSVLPVDPKTNSSYSYRPSADGQGYQLCATLEAGGEDCLRPDVGQGGIVNISPMPVPNASTSTSPFPPVSPLPINHFQSAGEQVIETGITAHLTTAKIEGKNIVTTVIYRNTSTSPQKVASLRLAMYGKSYGSSSTPSYSDIPLSPGQSKQFTLSFEVFEPPPYTFRYAKLEATPAVVLGTYSP